MPERRRWGRSTAARSIRRAWILGAAMALALLGPPAGAKAEPGRLAGQPAGWAPVDAAQLDDLTLGCLPGPVQQTGAAVTIAAGDRYASGPSRLRPWLSVTGDFGVAADLDAATPDAAADLSLYGTLPAQGDQFWKGLKRLDIGLRPGRLTIGAYTGDSASLSISQSFATGAPNRASRAGVRRIGLELVFFADGQEVGRIDDPGLFPSGSVDLGVNVAPHNSLTVRDLTVEQPAGAGTVEVVPGFAPQPAASGSLRWLAQARGFFIGAGGITDFNALLVDPQFRRTLGREFNFLSVPVYMTSLEPAQGRYDFCASDATVAFARMNGMTMRAATLIYQVSIPQWLRDANLPAAQLSHVEHDFIQTVVGRYKGQVTYWEPVNELFDTNGNWQSQFWYDALGKSYVDDAYRWVHETDPAAKIFYNDWGAEGLNKKSDAVYGLLQDLRTRGIPVDGMGLQSHFGLPGTNPPAPFPSSADVSANIKRLNDLGFEVQITEFDVKTSSNPTASDLQTQASMYRAMLGACLGATGCSTFEIWGVSDKYTWYRRPASACPFPGSNCGLTGIAPLMFDDNFQPKPAYNAIATLLAGG